MKLGGALKKIAPSGGRRENCWGISCEKSRFYKIFPILGGGAPGARAPPPLPMDPPLVIIYSSDTNVVFDIFSP